MLAMNESKTMPGTLDHTLEPEHQDSDIEGEEFDQSLGFRDCANGSMRDIKHATLSGVHVEQDVNSEEQSEQGFKSSNLSEQDVKSSTLSDQDIKSSTLSEQDLKSATLSELNLKSVTLSEQDLKSITISEIDLKSETLSERQAKSATLSGRENNQIVNNKTLSDPDLTRNEHTNALSDSENTEKHKENTSGAEHIPCTGHGHGAPDTDSIQTKDTNAYNETPMHELLLDFDSSRPEQYGHAAETDVDVTRATERASTHFSPESQGRDEARYHAEYIGTYSLENEHLSDQLLRVLVSSPEGTQVYLDVEGKSRPEEHPTGLVVSDTHEEESGQKGGSSSSEKNHENQETSVDNAVFTDSPSIHAQTLRQVKRPEVEKQLELGADRIKKKDADAFVAAKTRHNREQENTRLWVQQNARNMPQTIRKEMSEPETKTWSFSPFYSLDKAEVPPSEEIVATTTSSTAGMMVHADGTTQRTGSQTNETVEQVQASLELDQMGNTISCDDEDGQGQDNGRMEEQEKQAGKEEEYKAEKEKREIMEEDDRGKKEKEGEILFHYMLYSDAESSDDYDYEDGTCLTVDRPRLTARDSWDWTFPDANVSDLDVKYVPGWEDDKLTLDVADFDHFKGTEAVVDETGAGPGSKIDNEGGKFYLDEEIIENENVQIGQGQTKEFVMKRSETAEQKENESEHIDGTAEKKESEIEQNDGIAYTKEHEIEQIDCTAEKNATETEKIYETAEMNETEIEQIDETAEMNETETEQIDCTAEKNETETEHYETSDKNETDIEQIDEIDEMNETETEEIDETAEKNETETEQIYETAEKNETGIEQIDEIDEMNETETEEIGETAEKNETETEQIYETAEKNETVIEQIGEIDEMKETETEEIDENAEKTETDIEQIDEFDEMKETETEEIDENAEKNETKTEQIDKIAEKNESESGQIDETAKWKKDEIAHIDDCAKIEELESAQIDKMTEIKTKSINKAAKNQEIQSKQIEETAENTKIAMEQTGTTAENEELKWDQPDENREKNEIETEKIDEYLEEKENESEELDETFGKKENETKQIDESAENKTNNAEQIYEISDQGNSQVVTLKTKTGRIKLADSNTRKIKVKDKDVPALVETRSDKKTKVIQSNSTSEKSDRKAVRWHEAWVTADDSNSKRGKEREENASEAEEIITATAEPNQQLEPKALCHSSDNGEVAGISADDLMREYEHQLNEREKNGEAQKQDPLSHYNILPGIRPKRGKTSSEDEDIVYFENDAQMSVKTRLRYLSGNMDIGQKSTTVAENIKQKRNFEKENRRKAKKEFERRNIKRTVSKLDHLEARFIQRHLHTPDTSLLNGEADDGLYNLSPHLPTFMSTTGNSTPLQSTGRNPSISLDKSIGLMKYIRRRTMSRDWAVTKHELAHLKALNAFRMAEDRASSDEQLDRKSQMTPLQRFRHAGRMITVMLRAVGWKPQTVVEEDYNFLSWTIVYDEVLGISRLNYDKQGLTFDPLAFKASKESTITQDIKDILQVPSDQRTDENIRSVIRAFYNLVPAFGEFPIKIQQSMLKVCTYEKFKAGRVIIRQGHRAENFYFIISGCAVVTEMDSGGSHVHTANILGKGNSFGELAFLNMSQRSATVTCREDVELLCIEREDFIDIFLRGSTGKDPEHLSFLKALDIFKGWPVDKLPRDNPKICAATYVRRGVILCHDSNNSNWIFVVITGSCKVLKALDKEAKRVAPSAKRKPTRRRDVSGLGMSPSPQSVPEICILGDDNYLGQDDATWSALHSPRSGHPQPTHEHTDTSYSVLTSGCHNSGNLFRHRTDSEVRLCEIDHLNKIEQIFFTKHILPSIQDLKPTSEEPVQPNPRSRKVSTVQRPGTIEPVSASRLKRNSYGLHPPQLPQIATCTSRTSRASHGEPVGEKVFIEIVRLEPGDVFGLDHVLLDDMRKLTSCSLVSDGAEVVLMDKKYFRKHLTEETAKRMRQMVRPVPSERVLRQNLKTKDSWEAFKATSMAKRLGVARTGLSASSGS